ncbi:MAG: hypothetical protein R6U58_11530, partial [Bacteroidales bacterium]
KSSTSRIGKLLLPVLARGKEIYFVDERKGPRSTSSQMCLNLAIVCLVFHESDGMESLVGLVMC